jgi:hypothetical protein
MSRSPLNKEFHFKWGIIKVLNIQTSLAVVSRQYGNYYQLPPCISCWKRMFMTYFSLQIQAPQWRLIPTQRKHITNTHMTKHIRDAFEHINPCNSMWAVYAYLDNMVLCIWNMNRPCIIVLLSSFQANEREVTLGVPWCTSTARKTFYSW